MRKPDYWKRVVAAARNAPGELPAQMPFGFDTRVLADWAGRSEIEESLPWGRLLRGALVCASLLLLLSLAVNYEKLNEREPSSVAMADSALRMSMLP
jgi:hypothetical protein